MGLKPSALCLLSFVLLGKCPLLRLRRTLDNAAGGCHTCNSSGRDVRSNWHVACSFLPKAGTKAMENLHKSYVVLSSGFSVISLT